MGRNGSLVYVNAAKQSVLDQIHLIDLLSEPKRISILAWGFSSHHEENFSWSFFSFDFHAFVVVVEWTKGSFLRNYSSIQKAFSPVNPNCTSKVVHGLI